MGGAYINFYMCGILLVRRNTCNENDLEQFTLSVIAISSESLQNLATHHEYSPGCSFMRKVTIFCMFLYSYLELFLIRMTLT